MTFISKEYCRQLHAKQSPAAFAGQYPFENHTHRTITRHESPTSTQTRSPPTLPSPPHHASTNPDTSIYSLELSTGRVWDYTGDCYAHRALRGHLASSPEGGAIGGNDYGRRESHDRGGGSSSANYGGARGAGGAAAAGAAAGGGSGGRDGSPPLYSEVREQASVERER